MTIGTYNDTLLESLMTQYENSVVYPTQRINRPMVDKLLALGTFLPATDEDVAYPTNLDKVPRGWYITHIKKRYMIAIRPVRPDGSIAVLLGAMAHRANDNIKSIWVGQCDYLAYWKSH